MKICRNVLKNIIDEHRETVIFAGLFCIVSVMVLLLYIGGLSSHVLPYISYISNQDEEQMVHDFTTGMEISQQFSCYDDFDFITLSFSDHDIPQQGKLQIDVIEKETENSIVFVEKDMTDIHYAAPLKISFENIGGGKANQQYLITLRASDTKETALGVYGYLAKEQNAVVNGEKSKFALSIGIHSYTPAFKVLTVLVLAISLLAIVLVILGAFEFRIKEQHLFLLLAIPFALCMLMMWPGNSVYDEVRHYHTIYNYSNRILGYGNSEDDTQLLMRQCDILKKTVPDGLETAENAQAQRWGYLMREMTQDDVKTELTAVDIGYAPIVRNGTWIEYLPEIIGITLGRLLKCNFFWMGTLSRLMNIACYLALCYYAICKTPTLKSLFILLSALPMNLYQASGISYDGMTFGIGIVVFSFIMKLWLEGLEKREWICLMLFSAALGSCKGGVYLTILLLLCVVPKDQLGSKKWIKCIGVILFGGMSMLGAFIPTFMRWFGLGGNAPTIVNGIETAGGTLHLTFMLQRPLEFMKLLVLTLEKNADMYLGQMLGYRTAWANATISNVVILPFLIMLIWASLKKDDKDFEVSPKARIAILVILLIEIYGMHAIFLVETPVNSSFIIGCQGGYFILFIPCILLLFRNNGIVFREKRRYLYPMFSIAQLLYLYYFLELFMCA